MSTIGWTVGDGHKIDQIVEEFRFMASILGPEGALHRVADAYKMRLDTVQTYIVKAGAASFPDRRGAAA